MYRKRYIYHHFFNNKEVSKEEFLEELSKHCMRCDTNFKNPLMNIYYLDTKELQRKYNYLKLHPRTTQIYINDNKGLSNSFNIKRDLIQ